MRTHACCKLRMFFLTWIVGLSLTVLSGSAPLPTSEIKRLEGIVSSSPTKRENSEEFEKIVAEAIDEAAAADAYSVFEVAINNPDMIVRLKALKAFYPHTGSWKENARPDLKAILIGALLNRNIWPDPERMRQSVDGSANAVASLFQRRFCRGLGEVYGIEVEVEGFWNESDRISIAKRLGWEGADINDGYKGPLGSKSAPQLVTAEWHPVANAYESSDSDSISPFTIAMIATSASLLIWVCSRRSKSG